MKPGYKSDFQILKEHHKFLRDTEKDSSIKYNNPSEQEYGEILAKKYYDKLYKEYAIVDLSRYETGQIGMRWQTKQEVLIGKGTQKCANKTFSYEVNFAYVEDDERKNALVKVRVCEKCAEKLNYKNSHKQLEDDISDQGDLQNNQQKLQSKISDKDEEESNNESSSDGKKKNQNEKNDKKHKQSKKEKKIKKKKKDKKSKKDKKKKKDKL